MKKNTKFKRNPLGWILIIIIFLLMLNYITRFSVGIPKEMSYGAFYDILKNNPQKIKSLVKIETVIQGELADGVKFYVNIPEDDKDLLNVIRQNIQYFTFDVKPARTFWLTLLFNLGPILLLIFFWWMMASRGEQLGNRILTFGKVRPKIQSDRERV
ncbi:MAG: hypothetical protein NC916_01145, partial [Candidatus Omnitrophica bacterium]|nr:hypothetical protein [Candidatus Omnitrophota bacterium]